MKTKLLLFFITVTSFVKLHSQVIVNPVSSNITSNSATISATLFGNTAYVTFYQLATGSANNVASASLVGDQFLPGVVGSVNISRNLSGLLPNTTYYFRFGAYTNGVANQFSPIGFFTTANTTSPALIFHFPFNGNMTDIVNNASLTSTVSQTYESNGTTAGNALSVSIANTSASLPTAPTANLPLLPIGTQPRTLAMRVNFKTSSSSQVDFIAFWGTSTNGQAFGFEQASTFGRVSGWGQEQAGFSADFAQTFANNTWYNVVVTYNGTSTTLYLNGITLGTKNINLFTTGTNFVLGRSAAPSFGVSDFAIDDLRIYNYALSQTEVTTLNATLNNESFNKNDLEVSLYPNPVNNVLNIETALEIQNVEIYNIQGQKVLSSNQKQINVSDLAAGMYMVRIQDLENNTATKKIIIK